MREKFEEYVNKKFKIVAFSSIARETKSEIVDMLMDRAEGYIKEGKTEEEAYNLAIDALGSLSEIVKDTAKQSPVIDYVKTAAITALRIAIYFVLLTGVYLAVSFTMGQGSWRWSWIIMALGAVGFFIYASGLGTKKLTVIKKFFLAKLWMSATTIGIISLLYVILSLIYMVTVPNNAMIKNIWHPGWLLILYGIVYAIAMDLIYLKFIQKKKLSQFLVGTGLILFGVTVFLTVFFVTGWKFSWIFIPIFIFGYAVFLMFYVKKVKNYNAQNSK